MSTERRQLVRYLFLKLEPSWRRLGADEQFAHKQQFGQRLKDFRARLLLRTYSTVGTRGESDLMLWQAAEDLETLQALETAIFSTAMGAYLNIAHSFLAMTRKSTYEFPDTPEDQEIVRPADSKYLFVYPFVKTREWYSLPFEKRHEAMEEHVTIGRKYPGVRINTTFSFGLDDQEFMVAFEGDDPAEFLDLVMDLRSSVSSSYTERDTPTFTCLQMSIWEALDALGGTPAALERRIDGAEPSENGFTPVATTRDVLPGVGKRVYLGSQAIALFNVGGEYHAVNDRCTHGRASLSEGTVQNSDEQCVLECPWHKGRFDLTNGAPLSGPVRVPIKKYEVKVAGETILVR